MPAHRVETMARFRLSVTKKHLWAFLGSVGYYRKFVTKLVNYSALLIPAASNTAPGKVASTTEMLEAFHHLHESLCSHCVLTVPSVSDIFQLHASGVGVVIRDGVEYLVAFYSRQLRGPEHRYSATEIEALAVVCAVEHFAHFLFGAKFTMLTDYRPLTALLSSKTLNRRLGGMALKLMQFNLEIYCREGVQDYNADGLSRQAWSDETDDWKYQIPTNVEGDTSVADPDGAGGVAILVTANLSEGGCEAIHRKLERKEDQRSEEKKKLRKRKQRGCG